MIDITDPKAVAVLDLLDSPENVEAMLTDLERDTATTLAKRIDDAFVALESHADLVYLLIAKVQELQRANLKLTAQLAEHPARTGWDDAIEGAQKALGNAVPRVPAANAWLNIAAEIRAARAQGIA